MDRERGGIALGDSSQGLLAQVWTITSNGSSIFISGESVAQTTLLSDSGITEISLAFDQNMRPMVAYRALGVPKLYWYDTLLGAIVTTVLPSETTSYYLTLDDHREGAEGGSDVLMFYLKTGSLFYRQQRDRFLTERLLSAVPVGVERILKVGLDSGLRIQIHLGQTV